MEEKTSYPRELKIKLNKPNKLDEVLELSKQLSSGFHILELTFIMLMENNI